MKRYLAIAVVLTAIVAAFGVTQVDLWRTGRHELAPLELVAEGPDVAPMSRIWVDTDAACGATTRTDPDDCLAILWLVSRDVDIAGISTSFGNARGNVVQERLAALVAQMTQGGLRVPPVYHGHAKPSGTPHPPGVTALQKALEGGPLTILALGPLTNVAAALEGRPDLHRNVIRIVAVMGHQSGHLFHPTEGSGTDALFGHGPIFPDLNLSADPASVSAVTAMRLPITLIPYDAARATVISAADLQRLARQGPAQHWVASTAREWLKFWNKVVGLPGFYPFDWVAAAYVVDPALFDCARVTARVTREWTFWIMPRASLVIDDLATGVRPTGAQVLYCPKTAASLHHALTTQ